MFLVVPHRYGWATSSERAGAQPAARAEGLEVGADVSQDRLDEERAALFALLGRLLSEPPDAALLARLRGLGGGETPLGRALGDLAAAAKAADPAALEREHFNLFIGVGRGELMPYASWYLTGFLHDRPLAELRGTLRRLGVERAPGVPEPEDHIAFVCETLAGLIEQPFPRRRTRMPRNASSRCISGPGPRVSSAIWRRPGPPGASTAPSARSAGSRWRSRGRRRTCRPDDG